MFEATHIWHQCEQTNNIIMSHTCHICEPGISEKTWMFTSWFAAEMVWQVIIYWGWGSEDEALKLLCREKSEKFDGGTVSWKLEDVRAYIPSQHLTTRLSQQVSKCSWALLAADWGSTLQPPVVPRDHSKTIWWTMCTCAINVVKNGRESGMKMTLMWLEKK